jgi:hypothetical protein
MPVVSPMISAANGALLIPYIGSGQGRLTLLGAWLMVAVDTARGSATGRLFRPTSPARNPDRRAADQP